MKRSDVELDMRVIRDTAIVLEMSVFEARAFVKGDLNDIEEFETALDEAQGEVFSGNANAAYLVIKVIG